MVRYSSDKLIYKMEAIFHWLGALSQDMGLKTLARTWE